MTSEKITFVGAGNMAKSIAGGLIDNGYNAEQLTLCTPVEAELQPLVESLGVNVDTDSAAASRQADIVILAIKPQIMPEVCQQLRGCIAEGALVISVAAGIPCESMTTWLGETQAIVRCMPNTPALVGQGATGLFANARATGHHRQQAQSILGAVGTIAWVDDEALIDTVTAVSGSGPAYFFLLMESMIEAGIEMGLSRQNATELTLQTAYGAATLAKSSNVDVAELRRRVTSPNGTTERAIHTFEASNSRDICAQAMRSARDRAQEMAKEFNQ